MFFGEILHFLCNRSHCWEFYTIPSNGQKREGGIWSKEGRRRQKIGYFFVYSEIISKFAAEK